MDITMPRIRRVTMDDLTKSPVDEGVYSCECANPRCRDSDSIDWSEDEQDIDEWGDWSSFGNSYYCPKCTRLIEEVLGFVTDFIEQTETEQALT